MSVLPLGAGAAYPPLTADDIEFMEGQRPYYEDVLRRTVLDSEKLKKAAPEHIRKYKQAIPQYERNKNLWMGIGVSSVALGAAIGAFVGSRTPLKGNGVIAGALLGGMITAGTVGIGVMMHVDSGALVPSAIRNKREDASENIDSAYRSLTYWKELRDGDPSTDAKHRIRHILAPVEGLEFMRKPENLAQLTRVVDGVYAQYDHNQDGVLNTDYDSNEMRRTFLPKGRTYPLTYYLEGVRLGPGGETLDISDLRAGRNGLTRPELARELTKAYADDSNRDLSHWKIVEDL